MTRFRTLLVLLTILSLSSLAYASHFDDIPPAHQEGLLELSYANQEEVFYGKNVRIMSYSYDKVVVMVDGILREVLNNATEHVNGLNISLVYLKEETKFRNWSVVLNVTSEYVCGNGQCEATEDFQVCCKDCGCNNPKNSVKNKSCFDNQCIFPEQNVCANNSQCDDDNPCTEDICQFVPRRCVNEPITYCHSDDGCCPISCNEERDTDCSGLDLCKDDSDCDDSNISTTDKCSGLTKRCLYKVDNEILEQDSITEGECINNSDCDDNNESTFDKCSGVTKLCINKLMEAQITEKTALENESNLDENLVLGIIIVLALVIVIFVLINKGKNEQNKL